MRVNVPAVRVPRDAQFAAKKGSHAACVQVTRFNSFAPPRKNINAKWYINGATYFEDVADAMEAATRCALN